jgi:hypothetical protein
MFIIETLIEIIRALVADEMSERLTSARRRFRRGPKGMTGVRRHIHRRCRQRLLNRLST